MYLGLKFGVGMNTTEAYIIQLSNFQFKKGFQ